MAWSPTDIPDVSGKTAIVTGANSGIGYFAALELARKGAKVVLACRSEERGRAALDRLQSELPDAHVELASLDLASLDSVRAFASGFLERHDRLELLLNNAGVMAIPRRETADGFEMQIGTNHFGHFALTGLLLDCLIASGPARVVNVSSMAHAMGHMNFDDLHSKRKYKKWAVYGQSKLANVHFTYELQRKLEAAGVPVISLACHPGYAATNLQQVGPQMSGSTFNKILMGVGNFLMAQSAEQGAWPTLYAATTPDAQGGDFIGPKGMAHTRGAPVKHASAGRSHKTEHAERLWEVSVEATGVDYAVLRDRSA
ncbi:MAG: SDR family oxidoreductase [Candidatus Hydrogenedentes bacterium]|nr:SDR family oxidoreductase [Candidatus Hydrogenedentota bacterium]